MNKLLLILFILPCLLFGQTAEDYYEKALYYSSDSQSQIDNLTEAIKINPDFADAYHHRGFVKNVFGKHIEAIEDFTVAIKINPDFAKAYYHRGIAKNMLGKHIEAIEDFTVAIKINPDFADAYNSRGATKTILGKHIEAIEDFTVAIKIKPDFADAYNGRGIAKYHLKFNYCSDLKIACYLGLCDTYNKKLCQ